MVAMRDSILKAAAALLKEETHRAFLQYASTQTDDELVLSLYQALHQDGEHNLDPLLEPYGL